MTPRSVANLSEAFGSSLTAEIEAVHRELSRHNLAFLKWVESHPEGLRRSSFAKLEGLERLGGYPMQSWPTFVSRSKLRWLARLNVDLCRLVKAVPTRVFGNDPDRLAAFYGLEAEHARVAAAALGNEDWVGAALGRSDFFNTAAGFKCLEFNVASNLGGWQSSYWAENLLETPVVARFVESARLEPECVRVLWTLVSYLLRRALHKFRSKRINIGFVHAGRKELAETFLAVANQRYRLLLDRLGGFEGALIPCTETDLVERAGQLYAGEERLHVLLDVMGAPIGSAPLRCWLRGSLELYNGPLAPLFSDKRNLALLSELAESDLFDAAEKEVIRAAVPWTRRVAERPIRPGSAAPPSRARLVNERRRLVLKPGGGRAGEDVHLGIATAQKEWERVVDRALAEGTWVVQERLESLPHLYQRGEVGCAPHDVVWSFFVFGDTYGGCDLRMAPASAAGVVNAARGALVGTIFEVED